MIYLLDTDTLIFLIRGLKSNARSAYNQAHQLVERCQNAHKKGHSIALSAITVSELEFGAQKSGQYESEISAVNKVLTPFDVFAYDAVLCPRFYGQIRHDLESKGKTIGSMDLLIAAHALALDATLVSNNLDHFSRVTGLKSISWLS